MKNKFSRKSLLLVSMTVILATVINLFAGVVAFAADDTTTYTIDAVAFATDGSEGDGTKENPYLISKPGHLVQIASGLDKYYKLTKSLNLEGAEWTPLGTGTDTSFTGTFDGNGYTISNFKMTTAQTNARLGFFGWITNATVKDLTLDQVTVEVGDYAVAALVAESSGSVVSGCTVTANVQVSNSRSSGGNITGGVVAWAKDGSLIENCVNNAKVSTSCAVAGPVGGIVGRIDDTASIQSCQNNAAVSSTTSTQIGGIVGYCKGTNIISYCENNGDVTLSGNNRKTFMGGIAAQMDGGNVKYCVNNGAIATGSNVANWGGIGGILGNANASDKVITVTHCVNSGNVSDAYAGTINPIGGVVGVQAGSAATSTLTISYNYNFGTITTKDVSYLDPAQILGRSQAKYEGEGNRALANDTPVFGSAKSETTKTNYTPMDDTITTTAERDVLLADATYLAIVAEVAEHLTGVSTDLYGYQTTKKTNDNKFDMRLVATLSGDVSKCTNVGFQVSVAYKLDGADQNKAPENDITVTTLYEAITATDGAGAEDETKTHTAASLGGDYIFVLACKNLPANATDINFTVTTFYTGANGEVYSETETFVVTVPEDTLSELAA